jgi:hypothetical protein
MLSKNEILVDDSVECYVIVDFTFSSVKMTFMLSSGLVFTMYENVNSSDKASKFDKDILAVIIKKRVYCHKRRDVGQLKFVGFTEIICTADVSSDEFKDVREYANFVEVKASEITYSLMLKKELGITGSIDAYIVERLNLKKAVEDCWDIMCVSYNDEDCVVNATHNANFNKILYIKIDFFVLRALCDYKGMEVVRDAMCSSEFYGDNPQIEHIQNLLRVVDYGVRDNTDLSFFYLYRICEVISRNYSNFWEALRYIARSYMYELFTGVEFEGQIMEVHDNFIKLAIDSDGGLPRLIGKLRDSDIYRFGIR